MNKRLLLKTNKLFFYHFLLYKAGLGWKYSCQCTFPYQNPCEPESLAWVGWLLVLMTQIWNPIQQSPWQYIYIYIFFFYYYFFFPFCEFHRMMDRTHKHLDKARNLIPDWIRSVSITEPEMTQPCPVSSGTAGSHRPQTSGSSTVGGSKTGDCQ